MQSRTPEILNRLGINFSSIEYDQRLSLKKLARFINKPIWRITIEDISTFDYKGAFIERKVGNAFLKPLSDLIDRINSKLLIHSNENELFYYILSDPNSLFTLRCNQPVEIARLESLVADDINKFIINLNEVESEILKNRFAIGVNHSTLKQLSKQVGKAPSRIRQIEEDLFDPLRASIRMPISMISEELARHMTHSSIYMDFLPSLSKLFNMETYYYKFIVKLSNPAVNL